MVLLSLDGLLARMKHGSSLGVGGWLEGIVELELPEHTL